MQLGGDDLAERFREAAGDAGGFDVVVDPLWGEPGVAAMEAAKRFTRHVALGQSAGMHASVSVATVRNKPLTIVGHTNYAIPFEDQQAAYVEMCEHAAAGRLTADVEATPLDDVASAWERLRRAARDEARRRALAPPTAACTEVGSTVSASGDRLHAIAGQAPLTLRRPSPSYPAPLTFGRPRPHELSPGPR